MGAIYASLDADDDVLSIGLNRAVDALQKKLESVRQVGLHPKTGEGVMVKKGRFGLYLQSGSLVANVPRDVAMEDVTLEQAVALLAEKGKPLKPKFGAKKAGAKKAGAKKVGVKKAAPAVRTPAAKTVGAKKKAGSKKAGSKRAASKAGVKRPAAKKAAAKAIAAP